MWAAILALVTLLPACPNESASNTNAPENAGDIHVTNKRAGDPATAGGSEYGSARPLAIVALAEARNVPADLAHAAIDRLADRLDVCATEQGTRGKLGSGAARVVAILGKDGTVSTTKLDLDADDGGASTAILCFVAPLKELAFPPTASDAQRGLAIEAMWGSNVPHSKR